MKRHLSYANVAATLALVFSMSGAAVAADHYLITSTKQISPKVLGKLRGHKGVSGANGATGATGPVGASGPTGLTGARGERGVTGEEGFEGENGVPGPRGFAGPAGATGAMGATGEKGTPSFAYTAAINAEVRTKLK